MIPLLSTLALAIWLSGGLPGPWQRPVPVRIQPSGRRRRQSRGEAGDPGQGLIVGLALSMLLWLLALGLLL
jgi:hypothetical protein